MRKQRQRYTSVPGYDDRGWRRLRLQVLAQQPLCRMCAAVGVTRAACIVDHVRPHRGNVALFWDASNLQGLCKECHDAHKQSHERAGTPGCDEHGVPLDVHHAWNTAQPDGA